MSYTKENYRNVEDTNSLHFMRDELDLENFGFTVIDVEEDWEGMEHDHADEEEEEVYYLVEGDVTITVEGEEIDLNEGDAIRVAPNSTRKIVANEESKIVAVGAP